MSVKEILKAFSSDLEDLITEVEDSDEITDDDIKSEIIDSLEDAQSSIADAMLCL